ncbi:MAG: nucleotidyltransferase [Acidobacteria bacterium]|nr:nucleotidyltransferase [Acidobacteriota bacterium]
MDDQNGGAEYSREPSVDDLVRLCDHLNEEGAKYVVIGGFAMLLAGYLRTTGDIDLLVDSSPSNIERIKKALAYLPDHAVKELANDEVAKYTVVRIADEIVIDLMEKACDVTYQIAEPGVQYRPIQGVQVPCLRPELLLQTKLSFRPKDAADRRFLEQLLAEDPHQQSE